MKKNYLQVCQYNFGVYSYIAHYFYCKFQGKIFNNIKVIYLEYCFSSSEVSSTRSLCFASYAIERYTLQATKAFAMDSSPCCQKKRAIFCLFINTAQSKSSLSGYAKRLVSGSSMSTISSLVLFFFPSSAPVSIFKIKWENKILNLWTWSLHNLK